MDDQPGSDQDTRDADVLARLEDRRRRTLARIGSLTRTFDDIVERSTDASRDDEHDPEGATIAYERAQVTALLRAAQAQLSDIDLALDRVAHGAHDTCERCRGPIPPERHVVRPETRTCVDCADQGSSP